MSAGVVDALRGGLVVSCQAGPGHPLRDVRIIAALAECAARAGAVAVRVDSPEDVRAVRAHVDVPIIGLSKTYRDGLRPLITTTADQCRALAHAGADVVALEATAESPRAMPLPTLVRLLHDELDVAVMADIADVDEGLAAWEAGADLVGTTLSGYTATTRRRPRPDLQLVEQLAVRGVRAVLEGNVAAPDQVSDALRRGAWSVVVGRAITDPLVLADRFVAAATGRPTP